MAQNAISRPLPALSVGSERMRDTLQKSSRNSGLRSTPSPEKASQGWTSRYRFGERMGFIGAAVCGKLVAHQLTPRYSTEVQTMWRKAILLALFFSAAGCQTIPHAPPRYIVSSEPMLFLGAPPNPSLCVAVDPARANGVWLWHPGRSGCASRTSLMDATMIAGTVARLASGAVEASFQISLMTGGPRHVRLELRDGRMREPSTGLDVATERRAELDMP